MPEGVDNTRAFLILMLESPILAFALVLIAKGIGGKLIVRAITLSFFTWMVYSLNTAIESLAFTSTTGEGALFTLLAFMPACIFCSVAVAWQFPPRNKDLSSIEMAKEFFHNRSPLGWFWRLALAAVIFVPIYLLFGSLVAPFTSQYFQEHTAGLQLPSQGELLMVLSVRSLLFLLACLSVIILWRRSKWSLFVNLGFALFILVGFLYMLSAYYMPLAVRVSHSLEILADSFAHAGLLVLLLAKSIVNRSVKPQMYTVKVGK